MNGQPHTHRLIFHQGTDYKRHYSLHVIYGDTSQIFRVKHRWSPPKRHRMVEKWSRQIVRQHNEGSKRAAEEAQWLASVAERVVKEEAWHE